MEQQNPAGCKPVGWGAKEERRAKDAEGKEPEGGPTLPSGAAPAGGSPSAPGRGLGDGTRPDAFLGDTRGRGGGVCRVTLKRGHRAVHLRRRYHRTQDDQVKRSLAAGRSEPDSFKLPPRFINGYFDYSGPSAAYTKLQIVGVANRTPFAD